jgi:hypothetical protein
MQLHPSSDNQECAAMKTVLQLLLFASAGLLLAISLLRLN